MHPYKTQRSRQGYAVQHDISAIPTARSKPLPAPAKPIPPARDRFQSRLLVWTVAPLLGISASMVVVVAFLEVPRISNVALLSIIASVVFALIAWRLKAATPLAACTGGIICLLLTSPQVQPGQSPRTGLAPLILLFALTHIATRAGMDHKAEPRRGKGRHGRNTAQVVANLGVAALLAFPLGRIAVLMLWDSRDYPDANWVIALLVLSSLTEATADTVSSEIGKAFGGRPRLLTTMKTVEPGTDGAITPLGTLAGVLAAAIVAIAGRWSMHLTLQQASIALAAGICGLMFDSLLGATVERKGWIGNDLVNFCSTAFAPLVYLVALQLFPAIGPHRIVSY